MCVVVFAEQKFDSVGRGVVQSKPFKFVSVRNLERLLDFHGFKVDAADNAAEYFAVVISRGRIFGAGQEIQLAFYQNRIGETAAHAFDFGKFILVVQNRKVAFEVFAVDGKNTVLRRFAVAALQEIPLFAGKCNTFYVEVLGLDVPETLHQRIEVRQVDRFNGLGLGVDLYHLVAIWGRARTKDVKIIAVTGNGFIVGFFFFGDVVRYRIAVEAGGLERLGFDVVFEQSVAAVGDDKNAVAFVDEAGRRSDADDVEE